MQNKGLRDLIRQKLFKTRLLVGLCQEMEDLKYLKMLQKTPHTDIISLAHKCKGKLH